MNSCVQECFWTPLGPTFCSATLAERKEVDAGRGGQGGCEFAHPRVGGAFPPSLKFHEIP